MATTSGPSIFPKNLNLCGEPPLRRLNLPTQIENYFGLTIHLQDLYPFIKNLQYTLQPNVLAMAPYYSPPITLLEHKNDIPR